MVPTCYDGMCDYDWSLNLDTQLIVELLLCLMIPLLLLLHLLRLLLLLLDVLDEPQLVLEPVAALALFIWTLGSLLTRAELLSLLINPLLWLLLLLLLVTATLVLSTRTLSLLQTWLMSPLLLLLARTTLPPCYIKICSKKP